MCIILAMERGGISKTKWCCHIIILIIEWNKNKTTERERDEGRKMREILREQRDKTKRKADNIRL